MAEEHREASNPARGSEGKIKSILTSKEADELGIPSRTPAPEPETCKFCGAPLYYEGIIVPFGKRPEIMIWNKAPQRCTCDKASAYWAKYDAEQERKRIEEERAEENRRKAAKINRLLGSSGIKNRCQQRTFDRFVADTPERKRCLRVAKEYADNFLAKLASGDGLYIEGTNGTGKTHLAAAIGLQLIEQGIPVVCKTSSDMLGDIKKAFDGGEASEYEVLKAYKDVDLLIIDDLGKEQCTDWSVSTLYSS
jgi:DNA replication protein DnaC